MIGLVLLGSAFALLILASVVLSMWTERTGKRRLMAASDYHLVDSGVSSGSDGGGGGTVIRVPKDPSRYAMGQMPASRGDRK